MGYTDGMQEYVSRHPLIVPALAAFLGAAAVALVIVALAGWTAHGPEMVRALSAAGLSWCM